MYSLSLLGGVSLEGPSGPLSGRAAQRRQLALLALLAMARGKGCSRDKLIGCLWPESDEDAARHHLRDSLYLLRKALGETAVLASGDALCLNPKVVRTDIEAFEEALERGDLEEAVNLYAGPFLDGFYISGAHDFERWVESERQRLDSQYARALESLAEQAERAGSHSRASDWWRRLAAHDPYNSRVAHRLMQALESAGDPANALQHAHAHELLLKRELGIEPSPELRALAERLRAEPAAATKVPGQEATGVEELERPETGAAASGPARRERVWSEAAARHPFLTRRNAGLSLIAALVLSGIAVTGWRLLHEDTTERPAKRESVAVLPFTNTSADPEDEYFTDGITDDIINRLSKIAALRVISRQSSMQYKGSEKSLRQIAEELDVATILEGGVQRVGDRVRINAQLIDAATDEHLWAEQYNFGLTDVFTIQSDVAQQIAAALRVTLTPEEKERIEQRPTDNVEAYDYYLRALALPTVDRAEGVELLERAVELDPSFALAYVQLSRAHAGTFFQGGDRSRQRLAMAKRAVDRALQLDPELAAAHAALGNYYINLGDEERVADSYSEALRLDPKNPPALRYTGDILLRQNRAEEAMAIWLYALSLDPRSYLITWHVAARFQHFHDFENAERYYDRAISLMPEQTAARVYRALLYLSWSGDTAKAHTVLPEHCGPVTWGFHDAAWRLCDEAQYERALSRRRESLVNAGSTFSLAPAAYFILKAWYHGRRGEAEQERAAYDSARTILEPLVREWPDDARQRGGLGIAYAGLGRREDAIREGRRGVELAPDNWFFPKPGLVLNLARIYMMLGDYDRALEQLARLPIDRGVITRTWLGADPLWEPLRSHPRFQALLPQ